MKEEKIAIYYIATNVYINYFEGFLESIKLFCKDKKKKIILLTDSEKEFHCDDIEIEKHYINDLYFPLILEMRFGFIERYIDKSCDYHFTFNANLYLKKEFDLNFKDYDLFISKHISDNYDDFDVKSNWNGFNRNETPINSEAYIEKGIITDKRYLQTCFVGGNTESFLELCKGVNTMVKKDLLKNIIPLWFDEIYTNKWIYFVKPDSIRTRILDINEHFKMIGHYFKKDCEVTLKY